jgi:hypothetical protein
MHVIMSTVWFENGLALELSPSLSSAAVELFAPNIFALIPVLFVALLSPPTSVIPTSAGIIGDSIGV